MKSCELCKSPAKVHCDSDEASLCWNCDRKVHSANFLVARHSRSLLCRVCQSPTPWTASGEKLGPSAVAICEKCIVDGASDDDREESEGANDVDDDVVDDDEEEYDGDEDGETELDVEDEDADDNQVVPLSYPPPPATSSSSDDESIGDRSVLLKRKRENVADLSEDDADCLLEHNNHREASPADSNDAIGGNRGNGGTLYRFLPLTSEAMGEKHEINRHRDNISGENNAGAVTGVCKQTKTVGS